MSIAFSPGTTFAGYRVESLVGRGGMGVVYRATDLSLQRPVALKLIAPELAEDERFRRRFLREARLAASLDHPGVVPIHEAGEHDGQLYLAMRLVEGTDLRTELKRAPEPPGERSLPILGQIASALDAAHRRDLVHRDVKPANVLLDEDGHAYLTDFGVTKQLGGDTTESGHIVGTLDYLAPEQIRGGDVDGRADGYALACVLYQCFAGAPPFHRESEGETLWAHMHDAPPPLRDRPALDGVLRQGLAKEPGDRYGTCAELVEAAREAVESPARKGLRALVRRRHAVLAAGLAALAAGGAALAIAVKRDGSSAEPPVGNGVAAIAADGGEVSALVERATAPSNIAVGEGAVWFLNTEDRTVSRLDPETKAVTGTFETRRVPTDIAAGGGALWVGNGGGRSGNHTVSVSRVDPASGSVGHTVKLPDRTGSAVLASFNWGHHDIVVGAGAVWARNPDNTVSRIDLDTGRLVATIDVEANAIAADQEGVWVVSGQDVVRIDPRTNEVGQTIRIPTESATAIAVGAGKVWVTSHDQGVVWQVEPGPRPDARTIDLARGVEHIAFGANALWVGNFVDGTLSRIDPAGGRVARLQVGAVQALTAGAGGAWVSTAGQPHDGTLPASVCGELVSGGTEPDVLIASDLPLQGGQGGAARAISDAIRLVLKQRGFRAGRFTVGYRSCDDSTAQTGGFESRRCAANANAYAPRSGSWR